MGGWGVPRHARVCLLGCGRSSCGVALPRQLSELLLVGRLLVGALEPPNWGSSHLASDQPKKSVHFLDQRKKCVHWLVRVSGCEQASVFSRGGSFLGGGFGGWFS